MTRREFDAVARAAVKAISWLEGWDAEHPSWVIRNGHMQPSKKLRLELLDKLQEQGITVIGWDSKNKRWEPKSNDNQ